MAYYAELKKKKNHIKSKSNCFLQIPLQASYTHPLLPNLEAFKDFYCSIFFTITSQSYPQYTTNGPPKKCSKNLTFSQQSKRKYTVSLKWIYPETWK